MQEYIGLDLGNSSIKVVVIDENKEIKYKNRIVHQGKIIESIIFVLKEIKEYHCSDTTPVMVTGIHAALLLNNMHLPGDIPCIEKGIRVLYPEVKSALEIGAQNVRFLSGLGDKMPPKFSINESCAGGTGSFFEDQMYRLGLSMDDYSKICSKATSVPRISGRCSVFAKTDIIHRQQEGVDTPDIMLGLCYATVRNIKATVIRNMSIEKPFLLCGGVQYNAGVRKAVKEIFELKDKDFVVDEDGVYAQAIGAAITLLDNERSLTLGQCIEIIDKEKEKHAKTSRLKSLEIEDISVTQEPVCVSLIEGERLSLGIDVGSTSTNIVLINTKGELVDFQYLRTKGSPKEVVKDGLRCINDKYGDTLNIVSAGVTGSGRYLIGKMIGADSIIDEITAQAKAAVSVDEETDTVFEIGGQDSKYIQIVSGNVKDFQMNKICAAGTGSFIEEQANRLQVPVQDYGKIALRAKNPVDLGERCTVFIESNISACQAKGVETEDILAGLCYSVIHNYLFKVVGKKTVGNHIMLQGGVCYNAAVIAAFQEVYGNRIHVSPYFAISGAYGAAKIAMEEIGANQTTFRGLLLEQNQEMIENQRNDIQKNEVYYKKAMEYFLDGYERVCDPTKKTIGIPYVLLVHKLFPMFREYFASLGFNCLLSPATDESIIAMAQQYAQAETCYPVKLIYGHMAWLAEQKVDYIFLPSVLTMKHEKSNVFHNYGCVYMQSAPQMIFDNMKLEDKGIRLLNPQFSLDFGQKAMASCMISVGEQLGKSKPACATALINGAMAVRKHTEQVEKMGERLLAELKPEDKVLVMVTRTYGIDDPVLNMNIPQELLNRGYKVITISHLPAHDIDISNEYENLYWPFGQHITSAAKMIAAHPNLFAVYLTNHGCGPDTMLSHIFQKEMGDKPYLNIEVDEHFSKVGVITRIEAFLNSVEQYKCDGKALNVDDLRNVEIKKVKISNSLSTEKKIYIPYLYPYSQLIASQLQKNGYLVEVLAQSNEQSVTLGQNHTMSKEYLSFVALLGNILSKEKIDSTGQYLVPQTEGSETDGMYARLIYDILGRTDSIVSPMLELIPFQSELTDVLFCSLLAGDMILAAPNNVREELIMHFTNVNIDLKTIMRIIPQINFETEKKIMLIGEPYILYDSYLNSNLIQELEVIGHVVQNMPLGEYLCYLWSKRATTTKQKKLIKRYIEMQIKVSEVIGTATPYNPCIYNHDTSNNKLKSVSGGNISYRMEKTNCIRDAKAVIHVSSTYENAQTILDLSNSKSVLPILSLNFEGTNQENVMEKLHSFAYYLK